MPCTNPNPAGAQYEEVSGRLRVANKRFPERSFLSSFACPEFSGPVRDHFLADQKSHDDSEQSPRDVRNTDSADEADFARSNSIMNTIMREHAHMHISSKCKRIKQFCEGNRLVRQSADRKNFLTGKFCRLRIDFHFTESQDGYPEEVVNLVR